MYLEHFSLKRPPFEEGPDPDFYFPGAGRDEVLAALLEDIRADKRLIKLVGEEGSGKTMLCAVLRQRLEEEGGYQVLGLDDPGGAFDDMIRGMALELGLTAGPEQKMEELIGEMFSLLRERRAGEGRRFLLIIDEAEKIFLASLERLIKLLCEQGDEPCMQVLLAGRPALDVNLEQLKHFCADVDVAGGHVLEPMSREDTAAYLGHRLEVAGRPADDPVFTPEMVDKIHDKAKGNMRHTSVLADEMLKEICQDKPFHALLRDMPESSLENVPAPEGFPGFEGERLGRAYWIGGGVAVIVVVLGILALLGGGGEDSPARQPSHAPVSARERTAAEQAPGRHPGAPPGHPSAQGLEEEQGHTEFRPVHETFPDSGPDSEEQPSAAGLAAGDGQQAPPADHPPADTKQPQDHLAQGPGTPQGQGPGPGTAEQPPAAHTGQQPGPKEPVSATGHGQDMPGKTPEAGGADTAISQGPSQVRAQSRHQVSACKILEERIRAAASWVAGSYYDGYTIQLMMLASESAEENVCKTLGRPEYQAVKDSIYVLRKNSRPPTIYVFHGIYKTAAEARQARNNLPVFLRRFHPYPLRIRAAMQKMEN